MSKPKYRRGRKFRTTGEAVNWILGGGWIYLRKHSGRPTHPGWSGSMTIHTLCCFVKRGRDSGGAYRAVLK